MRKKGSRNGVTALAVAGTNVVVLGWDMSEEDIRTRGILGFAIQRTRHVIGFPSHPSERVSKALSLGRMGRTAASAVDFRCLDRHDR